MRIMLCRITDWIGWALIELADRVGHEQNQGQWYDDEDETLRNRVAGALYNAGCTMYGAFDQITHEQGGK
jgi:hypothetical protein